MRIGGFQKTSLIDYPGRVSCILFLAGCNFDCPYCHNPELVRNPESASVIDESQLLAFLAKRRGLLDGVVITGGEPTLQSDLPDLCRTIKSMGFAVKLDTNGSRPAALRQLIADRLLDFIAMDIKTEPDRYRPIICGACRPSDITESVRLILSSSIPHEFRTTCVRPIIDDTAIDAISMLLSGAQRHALQRVQHETCDVLHPEFFKTYDWYLDDTALERFQTKIAAHVGTCIIR